MKTECIEKNSRFIEIFKKGICFLIFSLIWLTGCRNENGITPTPSGPVSPGPTIQGKADIKWLTSLDDARKEAITRKKLLMLHFYTTWGDWSIKMDKETYTYYQVIDLTKNFVCVRIDLDQNPDLETTYGITGHPTIIFEDPFTGKEIKKIEGIRDRHEMTEEMKEMLSYKVKAEGGAGNE